MRRAGVRLTRRACREAHEKGVQGGLREGRAGARRAGREAHGRSNERATWPTCLMRRLRINTCGGDVGGVISVPKKDKGADALDVCVFDQA